MEYTLPTTQSTPATCLCTRIIKFAQVFSSFSSTPSVFTHTLCRGMLFLLFLRYSFHTRYGTVGGFIISSLSFTSNYAYGRYFHNIILFFCHVPHETCCRRVHSFATRSRIPIDFFEHIENTTSCNTWLDCSPIVRSFYEEDMGEPFCWEIPQEIGRNVEMISLTFAAELANSSMTS